MKRGKRPILDHFLLPWEDGGSIGKGQMGLMQQNVLFSDFLFKMAAQQANTNVDP